MTSKEKWDEQIDINQNQHERLRRLEEINATLKERLDVLEDWRDREIERQARAETKDESRPVKPGTSSSPYQRGVIDGHRELLAVIFRNRA